MIFQTSKLSLKYLRFTSSGWKNIEIRTIESAAEKTEKKVMETEGFSILKHLFEIKISMLRIPHLTLFVIS